MENWQIVSEKVEGTKKRGVTTTILSSKFKPYQLEKRIVNNYYGTETKWVPYIGEHSIGQMYGYVTMESAIEFADEFIEVVRLNLNQLK